MVHRKLGSETINGPPESPLSKAKVKQNKTRLALKEKASFF